MMWLLWVALGYLIAGCLMAAMAKWDVEEGAPFTVILIVVALTAILTPWVWVRYGKPPWTLTNYIGRKQ